MSASIQIEQRIDRTNLDGNLRIITETIRSVRSVSVGFWFSTGSCHEAKGESGISHLIEHLLFKGTTKRSAKDIAFEFEAFGADVNAFTGREDCCFHADFLDDDLPKAVEIFSDMLANSVFSPKDIEFEKNVIIEEINLHNDSPPDLIHDIFMSAMFGDHPLGRPILGEKESVMSLDRDKIVSYYAQNYCTSNAVIAAAGNLDHQEFVELVSQMVRLKNKNSRREPMPKPAVKRTFKYAQKNSEQAHICYGMEGVPTNSKDRYALSVLANIVGGGMSSRLFQEVRENRGLAYSIFCSLSSFSNTGTFYIYAGARPDSVVEIVQVVDRELEKIKREGVTREEVERSKQQIKADMILGLEDTTSRMFRLGKSLICRDEVLDLNEIIRRVNAVTQDEIMSVFEKIYVPDKMVLTVLGNLKRRHIQTLETMMRSG